MPEKVTAAGARRQSSRPALEARGDDLGGGGAGADRAADGRGKGVREVADGEDHLDGSLLLAVDDDVAARVRVELFAEQLAVGLDADADEHAAHGHAEGLEGAFAHDLDGLDVLAPL